mmetsp:Transcript_22830/g.33712  ORF Transcript_22830/g.33712 Transcript_22830/m.33712 type:complete len:107 (+) Transcript_22830:340-660(+)
MPSTPAYMMSPQKAKIEVAVATVQGGLDPYGTIGYSSELTKIMYYVRRIVCSWVIDTFFRDTDMDMAKVLQLGRYLSQQPHRHLKLTHGRVSIVDRTHKYAAKPAG